MSIVKNQKKLSQMGQKSIHRQEIQTLDSSTINTYQKVYVIIGWCGGLGGAHIYTSNKCLYLKSIGWRPIVLYSGKNLPVLNSLKEYTKNRFEELDYLPAYFSLYECNKVLEKMMKVIEYNPCNKYIIESNEIRFSYWGELLAERIQCKHYAFLLSPFFVKNAFYSNYLIFKLSRKEVAGTRESSLPELFGSNIVSPKSSDNVYFRAWCTNSVADIHYEFQYDIHKFDLRIGHIGRDTKPYVEHMVLDLFVYAKNNPDIKILFCMIGGQKNSWIQEAFDGLTNVTVLCTGKIFPIPKKLIESMDVGIGSSGCIRVGVEHNLKMITYLDNGIKPLGIYEYDIRETVIPSDWPLMSLNDLLNNIRNGLYDSMQKVQLFKPATIKDIFTDFENDSKIIMHETSKYYYDTRVIIPIQKLRILYILFCRRLIPFKVILYLWCLYCKVKELLRVSTQIRSQKVVCTFKAEM